MKTKNQVAASASRIVIRLILVALIFCATRQAWAGFLVYRGQTALRDHEFKLAASTFEQLSKIGYANSESNFGFGKSVWQDAELREDPKWRRLALDHLKELNETRPSFGRGWIYRALLESNENPPTDRASWQRLRELLLEARNNEPGNLFIAYLFGMEYLAHSNSLSEADVRLALYELRRSMYSQPINPDYPLLEKPSAYLEPALGFLWRKFRSPERLLEIVPSDRASYQLLLEFMQTQRIGKKYAEVFEQLEKFKARQYIELLAKGKEFFDQQKYDKALLQFKKAFLLRDWSYPEAKVGVLASQFALRELGDGKNVILKETTEALLVSILEDEDATLGDLLPLLKPVLDAYGNHYTRGLYAWKLADGEAALSFLESGDGKFQRRILAQANWQLGHEEKAIALLKPALEEEKPDLRELTQLLGWAKAIESVVQEKIAKVVSTSIPTNKWWGTDDTGNILTAGDKRTISLNVFPGYSRVTVYLRKKADDSLEPEAGAFVTFSVQGKPMAATLVDSCKWQTVQLELRSTGGWRHLAVKMKATESDVERPVAVELGPVKVEALSG